MALLDLQELEVPEAPSGPLSPEFGSSHSCGGGSNASLLLCG